MVTSRARIIHSIDPKHFLDALQTLSARKPKKNLKAFYHYLLQKLIPAISKCREIWSSSVKYHTTGSSYWMKFMVRMKSIDKEDDLLKSNALTFTEIGPFDLV